MTAGGGGEGRETLLVGMFLVPVQLSNTGPFR